MAKTSAFLLCFAHPLNLIPLPRGETSLSPSSPPPTTPPQSAASCGSFSSIPENNNQQTSRPSPRLLFAGMVGYGRPRTAPAGPKGGPRSWSGDTGAPPPPGIPQATPGTPPGPAKDCSHARPQGLKKGPPFTRNKALPISPARGPSERN